MLFLLRPLLLQPRSYTVLINAHYEVQIEADTAQDAEQQARYMVQGSTSDGPILGPGSWTFNAVAENEWAV